MCGFAALPGDVKVAVTESPLWTFTSIPFPLPPVTTVFVTYTLLSGCGHDASLMTIPDLSNGSSRRATWFDA